MSVFSSSYLNKLALRYVARLIRNPKSYGVEVLEHGEKIKVIDAGVNAHGTLQAGLNVLNICLSGLASTHLTLENYGKFLLPTINVAVDHPAIATLASQAAFKIPGLEELIISGPGRTIIYEPKDLLTYLGIRKERSKYAVFVIQSDVLPHKELVRSLHDMVGEDTYLYAVITPLKSITGIIQVCGRVIENVLLRLHSEGFDVRGVVYALGRCPLPPLAKIAGKSLLPDDMLNNLGEAYLWVDQEDQNLRNILKTVVSSRELTQGNCFYELLLEAGGDFRKIKGFPKIFTVARVVVNNIVTGAVIDVGSKRPEIVDKCHDYFFS